jgi:hypothetical protein
MKGIKHGHGSEVFPNGDVFKGSYKMDNRHGNGLSVNLNSGIIHRGEYREGKTQG